MMASQNFERLLLQATGTMDASGQPTVNTRDGAAQMSMSVAGIIKKYKRTLMNFQEDFMIPLIQKAAYRFMQFDPERYPTVDLTFMPTATLGIVAREYEQSQLIALLQTLGPDTPVLPMILRGIVENSSLSNKADMVAKLEEMMQPNPEQEAIQQEVAQVAKAKAVAEVKVLESTAMKNMADVQQTGIENQLMPMETQAKMAQGLSANIRGQNTEDEFAKRAKIAELMLKEKDINNRGKIVELQMSKNQ
jgi:hypothetical protein